MFLLGLLAELDETVLIVELDSVLMLLDDFLLDELFTGRTPPRWLFDVVEFIDDELATSLLLDSTNGFTLELLMLELEVSFDETLLDDELFTLELFLLLPDEILLELEISFDEALLDDELLTLELLITLDCLLELFTALDELMLELLIALDCLLELFTALDELMLELLCLLLEVEDEVDELSECGITSVEFIYVGSSVTVT